MKELPSFRQAQPLLVSSPDIRSVRQAYVASLHPSDSFKALPSMLTRRNAWRLYSDASLDRPRDLSTFLLDGEPLHLHHVREGQVLAYQALPDHRPALARNATPLFDDVRLGDRLVLAQAVGLCHPRRGKAVAAVTVNVTDVIPWERSSHWSFLPEYGAAFTPADIERFLHARGETYRQTATDEQIETYGAPEEVTLRPETMPVADLPNRVYSVLRGCSAMDDDSFVVWVVRAGAVVQFASWHERSPVPELNVRVGDVVYGRHEHCCAADCDFHQGGGSFEARITLT